MYLNHIEFAGTAGGDAMVKALTESHNLRFATFSLCHDDTDKNGKKYATWVNVCCYGYWCDTASLIKKGDNVVVSGKLRVETYDRKDGSGTKGTNVKILANAVGIISQNKRQPAQTSEPYASSSGFASTKIEIPPDDFSF